MSDMEKWLSEGLSESLGKKSNGAGPPPAPSPQPPTPEAPSPSKKPPSLSKKGIGMGGKILNSTTKIRSQGDNPVTNPRASKAGTVEPRPSGAKTVPLDPVSDFKAANPALAAPALFTGMDIDTKKKPPLATEAAPALPPLRSAPPEEFQPNMETTIRQLLEQANRHPEKKYNVISEGRFWIYTEILVNRPSGSQG